MTQVDCSNDAAWEAYAAGNPAVWGFPHLRPRGQHLLPLFRKPPPGALKVVLAGPPASGKTTVAKLFGLPKAFEEPVGEWVSVGPERVNVLFPRPDVPHGLKEIYLGATAAGRVASLESPLVERSPIDTWGVFLLAKPLRVDPADWTPESAFGNAFEREVSLIAAINELTEMMSATRVVVVYMRSSADRSHRRRVARDHATDRVSLEEHAAMVEAHERFYNAGTEFGFEVKIVNTNNDEGHDHRDTKVMIENIIAAGSQ